MGKFFGSKSILLNLFSICVLYVSEIVPNDSYYWVKLTVLDFYGKFLLSVKTREKDHFWA